MSDTEDIKTNKSRARITLSCAQCKRRKVKCDRKLPCSSCIKHNVADKCGYFGDQVVAQKPSTKGGVSVFRAFADDNGRVFRPREHPLGTAMENGLTPINAPDSGGKNDPSNHPNTSEPPTKRPRDDGVSSLHDPQHAAQELGRLKSKLHHLEASLERAPAPNGPAPNNIAYSGTSLPPPGPIASAISPGALRPPVPPVPSVLTTPVIQMGPMYGKNGLYLGSSSPQNPPMSAYTQQQFQRVPGQSPMSPSGFLPNTPIGYYPNNSPQLGSINNPNGITSEPQNSPPQRQQVPPFTPYNSTFQPGQGRVVMNSAPNNMPYSSVSRGPSVATFMPPIPPMAAKDSLVFSPSAGEQFSTKPVNIPVSWVGVNPYDLSDPDEEFDLYSGYNPIYAGVKNRTMNHGPLSWFSYVQKDNALKSLWDYTRKPHEWPEYRKVPSLHGDDGPQPPDKDALVSQELKAELNKRTISLGLTVFEGEVDSNMHLIGRITLMLPTKKAIKVLVDRFFKSIYPYFPLLDEAYFRKEIQRILGPFSLRDERHTKLNATQRYDTATLGILLLVLRMSYLSAFSNHTSENEQVLSADDSSSFEDSRYILTNPINIDVVPIAQLCLDQYDLYQRTNLTVLQCAVLIRAYFSIAPEEGDSADGHESNVFNVMCLQTAYCMGLNREPNKIHNHSINPSRDNLSRKLWFFIKLMDMKSSYHFGFPLMADENYTDSEVPFYSPGSSNVADESVEKGVCEILQLIDYLYSQMRVILKRCISIKQLMKIRELTVLINQFETETKAKLGCLSELLTPIAKNKEVPYMKVLRTKAYLNIKTFTLSIFYHLFLNYEKSKKHELAFFYMRKFLSVSCGEFLIEVLKLIKKREIFDSDCAVPGLMLNPAIVFLIHKSNQVNLRLVITLNYMISVMESDKSAHNIKLHTSPTYKNHYSRVCKLSKLLENCNKFSNSCLSVLGHRFFYAWRLSKVHSFLIETVVTKSFKEYHYKNGKEPLQLTPDRINELLDIVEKCCSTIKRNCQSENFNGGQARGIKLEPNNGVQLNHSKEGKPKALIESDQPVSISPGMNHYAASRDSFATDGMRGQISDLSSNTSSSFEFADLDLGNTGEIDNLWQQINNIKNNKNKLETEETLNGGVTNYAEKEPVNSGDWYQGLFAFMPQNDMFLPIDGNGQGDMFSHLPL
ncbi:hypothetical protein JCM33374_g2731 [Metschnikowia sp. JCM 33374]|nr:hypothetical protein JCM33374_g2731 [Metschnikowia sp. JCM 33374]